MNLTLLDFDLDVYMVNRSPNSTEVVDILGNKKRITIIFIFVCRCILIMYKNKKITILILTNVLYRVNRYILKVVFEPLFAKGNYFRMKIRKKSVMKNSSKLIIVICSLFIVNTKIVLKYDIKKLHLI